MENRQKIKQISGKALKFIKVLKIISIILFVLSLIFSLLIMAGCINDVLLKFLNNHPKILNNTDIKFKNDGLIINITEYKIPLKTIVENNKLNELLLDTGLNMLVNSLGILLTFFILNFFKKAIEMINTSDTPFTEEIIKEIKKTFILIFVIVLLKSAIVSIIVGLSLSCVYYIFKYGIELQKESDETL